MDPDRGIIWLFGNLTRLKLRRRSIERFLSDGRNQILLTQY
jgi:hypothetical protein